MDSFTWESLYPLAVILLVLMLVQTLRLSITGRIHPDKPNVILNYRWLYPLGVLGPFIIGTFYKGALSPWPPAAYAKMEASSGLWAGLAALLAVVTVEIWMFWAAAKAIHDTTLTSATFRPMHDKVVAYYHVVNALVGAFILYKAWDTLA